MLTSRLHVLALLVATTATVVADASNQSKPAGPTFDVVSVKRNMDRRARQSFVQRPDGGLMATSISVVTLITRAYPPVVPLDIVGLPGWAMEEFYDVSATASLANPTVEQQTAMLRALLADRFNLAVHLENRERPVYDLVIARRDGRLGDGLKAVDTDCARVVAERATSNVPSAPAASNFNLPLPPCTLRITTASLRDRVGDKQGALGDLLEAEMTVSNFAANLRVSAGRPVLDRTGLTGVYRVRMNFDLTALRRGPDSGAATPDAPPSIFTAVQEQLGLKLESSRAPLESLVIDRLEHPTDNP